MSQTYYCNNVQQLIILINFLTFLPVSHYIHTLYLISEYNNFFINRACLYLYTSSYTSSFRLHHFGLSIRQFIKVPRRRSIKSAVLVSRRLNSLGTKARSSDQRNFMFEHGTKIDSIYENSTILRFDDIRWQKCDDVIYREFNNFRINFRVHSYSNRRVITVRAFVFDNYWYLKMKWTKRASLYAKWETNSSE